MWWCACRKRKATSQAARTTEVAVIPTPTTAARNNYEDTFGHAAQKANETFTSGQTNTDNLYCNWQQLPSAAGAGAVGGVDDDEYEHFEMYESLQDDSTEDPTSYEVIKPNRPITRRKPPKPY